MRSNETKLWRRTSNKQHRHRPDDSASRAGPRRRVLIRTGPSRAYKRSCASTIFAGKSRIFREVRRAACDARRAACGVSGACGRRAPGAQTKRGPPRLERPKGRGPEIDTADRLRPRRPLCARRPPAPAPPARHSCSSAPR
ncbi:hypothetical protein EVAR_23650_1 [Eumeta japonica]|uniref:Uncharacterized protein n=1 Tax=Eumeta variegata TaxID=151549 RepID=A0A4C1VL34_EUMVA|nr:hypothetical protein EVAR_23650_1 [Eumeta japonica]